MLDDKQILRDIHALPQDKQAEVLDFIAFVKARSTPVTETPPPPFGIRPAAESSGFENTSVNHDAILAEAAQDSQS